MTACDMTTGPCACGAWHKETKSVKVEIGKRYYVKFSSNVYEAVAMTEGQPENVLQIVSKDCMNGELWCYSDGRVLGPVPPAPEPMPRRTWWQWLKGSGAT